MDSQHAEAPRQCTDTTDPAGAPASDLAIAIVAHELRSPLAAVRGYAQLSLRRLDQGTPADLECVRAALSTIDGLSVRISALVERLLDVSRLDAGKASVRLDSVDLRALVQDAVGAATAARPDRCVRVEAPAPVRALVDSVRIHQVLANLLDNAFKYSSPESDVHVELTSTESGYVRITVRDHGSGIPEEARAHIFERYFQASSDLRSRGLGLGLFLSRALVQLHGGRLTAEYPADGGTRLVIELPTGGPRPRPVSSRRSRSARSEASRRIKPVAAISSCVGSVTTSSFGQPRTKIGL